MWCRAGHFREFTEMRERRLVIAHLLGRYHQIKRLHEIPLRLRKQILITICQHRQSAIHCPQTRQHSLRVREHRHRSPRFWQCPCLALGNLHPAFFRRQRQCACQHVLVKPMRFFSFQFSLKLVIRRDNLRRPRAKQRSQNAGKAAVPIHQRAKTIKRHPSRPHIYPVDTLVRRGLQSLPLP